MPESYIKIFCSVIVATSHSAVLPLAFSNSKKTVRPPRNYATALLYRRSGSTSMAWHSKQGFRRKHVGTIFMNCYVQGIFCSLRASTIWKSRLVYISTTEREDEKSTRPFVANDIKTVTEALNQDRIGLAWQTVISTSLKSSVLVFTVASVWAIKSNPLERRGEHVIVSRNVENILALVLFYDLVTELSRNMVHLPKRMKIWCGAESAKLREQRSRPYGPLKYSGKVNVV